MPNDLDHVWKALADPTRRQILDVLRDGPRLTTEIVEQFPNLSRFGVMKHLDVLREAGLVAGLYAYCRFTDDLVDDPEDQPTVDVLRNQGFLSGQ